MKTKAVLFRVVSLLTVVCIATACCGCWDYRGVDELTVVAGFALDESENGTILLSLEVLDASSSEDNTASSKLVQVEGKTIADAVYNINTQFYKNIYFGNADVAVLSHTLVEKVGINNLVDPLIRDESIRDNLVILVSKEDTAYQLITPPEDKKTIMSFDINNRILDGRQSNMAIKPKELYDIYGILARGASDLTLPAIRFDSKENNSLLLDGFAVFKDDELAGFYEDKDMPFYMIAVDPLTGGGFVYEKNEDIVVSLGIRRSEQNIRYEKQGDVFTFHIDVQMTVSATEYSSGALEEYSGKEKELQRLKQELEEYLEKEIKRIVTEYQNGDFSDRLPDIFGFANAVYYNDPALWEEVKDDWPSYLASATVEVPCKITINDTGLIKRP